MEKKIYVVLYEISDKDGNVYMGVFSTLNLAKKACNKYANRKINWDSKNIEVHESGNSYYRIERDVLNKI